MSFESLTPEDRPVAWREGIRAIREDGLLGKQTGLAHMLDEPLPDVTGYEAADSDRKADIDKVLLLGISKING